MITAIILLTQPRDRCGWAMPLSFTEHVRCAKEAGHVGRCEGVATSGAHLSWTNDVRKCEIDEDGEIWTYFPNCVKCGKMFAFHAYGRICCVCLAANS